MKGSTQLSWLLFIVILTLWESAVQLKDIPELILPGPGKVISNLYINLSSGYFLPHISATLIEVLSGFVVGTMLGMFLGFFVSQSKLARDILHPYIIASQAMPKLALAPLLVLWFGFGYLPKIIIVSLICFFPLFESTVTGLSFVDKDKLNLLRSFQATKFQILIKLRLPTAVPYLFSGLRVAMVLSVVGAVVSEFIGANKGLGAVITTAQGMMDTPLIFSSFVLLTIIGICLYLLMEWIEQKFYSKYYYSRRNNE